MTACEAPSFAFEKRPPAMAAVLFSELPSGNEKPPRGIRGGFFYFGALSFLACLAVHNAPMRRRNAFGFSANKRPARREAAFRCEARRAAISGNSRDRQAASG